MSRQGGTMLFLGTGATPPPPGRKNAAMLLRCGRVAILFDAPPDLRVGRLPVRPQAIFLTDQDAEFVRSARRMAASLGIPLRRAGRLTTPIVIEPRRVTHTRTHPTYAYRIRGKHTAVYAPEFYRFPTRLVADADIAILDGATWGRDVRFARGAGGHKDAATSVRRARDLGVRRVYLTHIGSRTQRSGPPSMKLRDGQTLRL